MRTCNRRPRMLESGRSQIRPAKPSLESVANWPATGSTLVPVASLADMPESPGSLRRLRRLGVELLQEIDGGIGDGRARAEDRFGAGRVELGMVLGWDHDADHHHDVTTAQRFQCPAASDDTPTMCTSFSTA